MNLQTVNENLQTKLHNQTRWLRARIKHSGECTESVRTCKWFYFCFIFLAFVCTVYRNFGFSSGANSEQMFPQVSCHKNPHIWYLLFFYKALCESVDELNSFASNGSVILLLCERLWYYVEDWLYFFIRFSVSFN